MCCRSNHYSPRKLGLHPNLIGLKLTAAWKDKRNSQNHICFRALGCSQNLWSVSTHMFTMLYDLSDTCLTAMSGVDTSFVFLCFLNE